MQVTVEVPDELVAALNLMGRDPAGAALEAMALEAYRERKLTGHQLRTLLGIGSRFEFWELLKQHEVETYTAGDLERDLEALKSVLPPA